MNEPRLSAGKYDKEDIYQRCGPAFPAASFCYVCGEDGMEPEMYSLVYDHNMDMVSEKDIGREVFVVDPFRCVNLVVCVEGSMDIPRALEKAKDAAEAEGYVLRSPYYISYLLSCGELDASKHYFEAMLPLV